MRIAAVGSGRSVHALSRSTALTARGHHLRFFTLGPVLPAQGLEVWTRPIPRSVGGSVLAALDFLRSIRDFRPELLHLHYAGGKLGTMGLLTGIHPLVVTVMGGDVLPEQHAGGLGVLERWATRRILAEADAILAKADTLRPAIAAFGGAEGKVRTVRWGIDPALFRRDPQAAEGMRRRLGISLRRRVILSPRHMRPLYNVHLILEAMPRIWESFPEAVLVLAEYNADGAYKRSLEARATELGSGDRVRFLGWVEQDEMPSLYSLADAVVSIPASDGLPQSLFEAMACEAPVVLGRLASYSEVVSDGVSAILVEFDSASVAGAVTRLLRDPALSRRIASAGLDSVKDVACLPREVDRVDALYRSLAARGSRRARRSARVFDALSLLFR